MNCYKCQNKLEASDFGRQDTCRQCGVDTRCCHNCLHYDRHAYNECRESSADRVVDKEKANFCDYFKPSQNQTNTPPQTDPVAQAKAKLDALFKRS